VTRIAILVVRWSNLRRILVCLFLSFDLVHNFLSLAKIASVAFAALAVAIVIHITLHKIIMGAVFSIFGISSNHAEQGSSLLELIDHDELDSLAITQRLHSHPEEAAAYAHSLDSSPLMRVLKKRNVSLTVVRAFLEAYEEAALTSDRTGSTALLEAVRGSALAPQEDMYHIVKLLWRLNEQACRQPDRKGRLPIHFVRCCPQTARLIVQKYPDGVSQPDSEGRLALHYVCSFNPQEQQGDEVVRLQVPHPDVVRLLVSNSIHPCGGALIKDQTNEANSPLEKIFREIENLANASNEGEEKTIDDSLWDIVVILIETAASSLTNGGDQDDLVKPPFRLVHALVSLHCPVAVLAEALRRSPDQALERDEKRRTPLLLAAANPRSSPAVLCHLIRFNPQAARMMDAEGRLPIDFLAENPNACDADVLEEMVRAEPRAVDTRDLKYHRHPFLTAALAGAHQSSIYHLLRAQPHVIKHFLHETD